VIKGYWEKRYDKFCESIYLIDDERDTAFTIQITAHKVERGQLCPSSDFGGRDVPLDLLRALAEALQMGGYIPKSAVDAELKATKYHLEDMRKLVLK
jgi:hypothetical protein